VDYKSDRESTSTWLVCREDVVKDVRFFDLFVGQTSTEQGYRIDGPHFEGPSDFEIYIVVGQRPAKSSLVTIGKWTYARNLHDELAEVLGRVVCLTGRQPRTQEALQERTSEGVLKKDDRQDDDSQKGSRDSDVDLQMGGV
jgi:hypothetical protein